MVMYLDDIVLLGTGIQNMNGYGIIGTRSANNTCTCSHHNCQVTSSLFVHLLSVCLFVCLYPKNLKIDRDLI